ncbi:MAG: hypothetical protein AB2693_23565, partial [Candidatus Thiodiazotropha sp.]
LCPIFCMYQKIKQKGSKMKTKYKIKKLIPQCSACREASGHHYNFTKNASCFMEILLHPLALSHYDY